MTRTTTLTSKGETSRRRCTRRTGAHCACMRVSAMNQGSPNDDPSMDLGRRCATWRDPNVARTAPLLLRTDALGPFGEFGELVAEPTVTLIGTAAHFAPVEWALRRHVRRAQALWGAVKIVRGPEWEHCEGCDGDRSAGGSADGAGAGDAMWIGGVVLLLPEPGWWSGTGFVSRTDGVFGPRRSERSSAPNDYTLQLGERVEGALGMHVLCAALSCGTVTRLKSLHLDHNRLGDDGARALASSIEDGALIHTEFLSLQVCPRSHRR